MKNKLKELGIADDMISKVYKLHQDEVSGNFIPKHRLDEVIEENKALKANVVERDTQLSSLKGFEGESNKLKEKIAALEAANTAKDSKYAEELKSTQLKTALRLSLAGKVHDADLVTGLIDKSLIQLDEKGDIKAGFSEQFETLKKDKAFLFITEAAKGNNQSGFKPAGTTPPDGGDRTEADEATAFGKSVAANRGNADAAAAKASSHYFGEAK